MTVVYVGAAIVAALSLTTAVAVRIGKAIHRADHRDGVLARSAECPQWCQHEHARASMPYGDPY
jgi:hypothetical protein